MPLAGLLFDGGSQTTNPGDLLRIVGTGAEMAIYAPNGVVNSSLDNDGTVTVNGRAIAFAGLEPIDIEGMLNATVVLPNGNDVLSLDNGTTFVTGQPAIRVSGSSGGVQFETVALRGNALVRIDTAASPGSDGVDTVTLGSANNAHGNANLEIDTGDGLGDMIEVNGGVTFAASVTLASQRIDFNFAASVVTAAAVTLNSGAGPISDSTVLSPSVVADILSATAGSGILLGTSVNTITTASVTAAGDLRISEASAVTVTSAVAASGATAIDAGGTLTVAGLVRGTSVTLSANETAGLDNLILQSAAIVQATSGNLILNAGDDIVIQGAAAMTANGSPLATISLNVDVGDADAAGQAIGISDAASLTTDTSGPATGGAILSGGNGNDTFSFAPRTTTRFVVQGNLPAAGDSGVPPGDCLNLDLSAIAPGNGILTPGGTPGDGTFTFLTPQTERSVQYFSIESGIVPPPGVDFVLDLAQAGFQDGAADTINVFLDAVTGELAVLVNGSVEKLRKSPSTVNSLTFLGSADTTTLIVSDTTDPTGDQVTITETSIEGLFGFAGAPDLRYQNIDALNVTGTGGDDVLDILLDPGSDLDTVTVNGNNGNDQFFLDLNTANHGANDVAGLLSINLNGDAGNDTFGDTPTNAPLVPPPSPLVPPVFPVLSFPAAPRGAIEPSVTTSIVINGGAPTVNGVAPFNATAGNTAGDTFNLDLTPSYANPSATAIVSTVSGLVKTTGYQNLNFSDIEAINVSDNGLLTRVQMGDLYVRGTENADTIQFSATVNPNLATTRVNSSIFQYAVTTKTIVYGRGGNDILQQGNLNKPAEFYGEAGDDYLAGYKFNDLLVGGDGNDRLLAGEGDNEVWGDNLGGQDDPAGGNDVLSAGSGNDKFYGGGGNDQVTASGGNDYASGGAGDDTLDGGDGDDRLYGGAGSDTLSGGNGNDLLAGNDGDDRLYGQAGNDVLIGGQGADMLVGDDGNDLLFDGQITASSPAGTDASTIFNDAHDAAMKLLLADWSTDSLLDLLVVTSLHDSSLDSLGGTAGLDTAAPGDGDVGDWEITL
jgi:hypothetical protein